MIDKTDFFLFVVASFVSEARKNSRRRIHFKELLKKQTNKRKNLLFARRESRCFVVFFLSPKITILNDFYTNDEDEEEKRGGAQPHDETPRTLFSNSRLMMMMMMMMMIV